MDESKNLVTLHDVLDAQYVMDNTRGEIVDHPESPELADAIQRRKLPQKGHPAVGDALSQLQAIGC
jgi:hypothetical protein